MRWLKPAAVPLIAVGLALGIGAIVLAVSGANPIEAYGALIDGSLSSQKTIGRTLEKATPLIMGGLAVAFAFRAGLFNIGGQGQLVVGGIFAAAVGFGFEGLPWIIHAPLALLVGAVAGAAWGSIAGFLKATSGAHETVLDLVCRLLLEKKKTFSYSDCTGLCTTSGCPSGLDSFIPHMSCVP